jgi:hypothetical protein
MAGIHGQTATRSSHVCPDRRSSRATPDCHPLATRNPRLPPLHHAQPPTPRLAAALAAEVRAPGRDFPRAMIATILLVTLVYVVPLCVAISLDQRNLHKWTDGCDLT